MIKTALSLMFLLSCITLYGAPQKINLLDTSASGRTLVLNIGAREGFSHQDRGTLLGVYKRENIRQFVPLALVKVVSVGESDSIVYAEKIYRKNTLHKGGRYLFLSMKDLLAGRREYQARRKKMLAPSKAIYKTKEEYLNHLGNDQTHLDQYTEGRKLHESYKWSDDYTDFELADFAQWVENDPGIFSQKDIFKSSPNFEFIQGKRVETYEKMVLAYLQKVNDPSYMDEMEYAKRMRQNIGMIDSKEFYQYQDQGKKKWDNAHKKKEVQALLETGARWSENMNDEDISTLISQEGVYSEIHKQEDIFLSRYHVQLALGFGLNLINNENREDFRNSRPRKTNLDLGAEWFAFRKAQRFLRRFSLKLGARLSYDALSQGSLNALSTEQSLELGGNWYPFKPVGSVKKIIFYLGSSLRVGFSKLEMLEPVPENGNYRMLGLGGKLGAQYHWFNGWGMKLESSLERLYLTQSNNSDPDGFLAKKINYPNWNLGMAITYLF